MGFVLGPAPAAVAAPTGAFALPVFETGSVDGTADGERTEERRGLRCVGAKDRAGGGGADAVFRVVLGRGCTIIHDVGAIVLDGVVGSVRG